ncbi:MAG: hypothetical protein PHG23_03600, partial [Candidatus Pacebacteria bacterium]|nr:hypothetical protein [Candidatus Paceibacterota bacterium]
MDFLCRVPVIERVIKIGTGCVVEKENKIIEIHGKNYLVQHGCAHDHTNRSWDCLRADIRRSKQTFHRKKDLIIR